MYEQIINIKRMLTKMWSEKGLFQIFPEFKNFEYSDDA